MSNVFLSLFAASFVIGVVVMFVDDTKAPVVLGALAIELLLLAIGWMTNFAGMADAAAVGARRQGGAFSGATATTYRAIGGGLFVFAVALLITALAGGIT